MEGDIHCGRKYTLEVSTASIPTPSYNKSIISENTVNIKISGTKINPPRREKNGTKVSEEWDFNNHEEHDWLLENCTSDWRWDWSGWDEDDNGMVEIEVLFYDDKESAMAFKLRWI